MFWTIVGALVFFFIGIPLLFKWGGYLLAEILEVMFSAYFWLWFIPWIIALCCLIGQDQGGALIWFIIGLVGLAYIAYKDERNNAIAKQVQTEKSKRKKYKITL